MTKQQLEKALNIACEILACDGDCPFTLGVNNDWDCGKNCVTIDTSNCWKRYLSQTALNEDFVLWREE